MPASPRRGIPTPSRARSAAAEAAAEPEAGEGGGASETQRPSSPPAFRGRGGTQAEGLAGEGLAESGLQTLTSHHSAAGPSPPVTTGEGLSGRSARASGPAAFSLAAIGVGSARLGDEAGCDCQHVSCYVVAVADARRRL